MVSNLFNKAHLSGSFDSDLTWITTMENQLQMRAQRRKLTIGSCERMSFFRGPSLRRFIAASEYVLPMSFRALYGLRSVRPEHATRLRVAINRYKRLQEKLSDG